MKSREEMMHELGALNAKRKEVMRDLYLQQKGLFVGKTLSHEDGPEFVVTGVHILGWKEGQFGEDLEGHVIGVYTDKNYRLEAKELEMWRAQDAN